MKTGFRRKLVSGLTPFFVLAFRLSRRRVFIRLYRKAGGILLDAVEMDAIARTLLAGPRNFLVFGVGHDSPFWARLNRRGRTVFLEDDVEWAGRISSAFPVLDIKRVAYTTRVTEYLELLHQPEKLKLELPPEVRAQKWDLILVDAPLGWNNTGPGRMQSIYAAPSLLAPDGIIFVHDCERPAEELYCRAYLADFACEKITRRLFRFRKTGG